MINFVNRLVIIIMIKADASGVRDFSFFKMTNFVKKDQLSWLHFMIKWTLYQFSRQVFKGVRYDLNHFHSSFLNSEDQKWLVLKC